MITSSVGAVLPFASTHEKCDVLYEWVPMKFWKSSFVNDELPHDDSDLMIAGYHFSVTESNAINKRRRLHKKLVAHAMVENWIDDGVCAPVISVEPQLQSGSSVQELRSDCSFSSPKSEVESCFITEESKICNVADLCNSELETVDDLSIRTLCISILRSHGLVGEGSQCSIPPAKALPNCYKSSFIQKCEKCGKLDDTSKMLICDNCDEAFHVSCCNTKTKNLPIDEWFCQFCSKLGVKVSLDNAFLKSCSISCWNRASPSEFSPIALMLKYPEPYTSRVRIGEHFQVEVPDWSDYTSRDLYCMGEPVEIDPADIIGFHGCFTEKFLRPSSISNWLQCQETMHGDARGGELAICGKWRRAPISEVQTDDWDCSCSVLWDPRHSDCAVPQELETDQVLVQLKYIEQLRSRLARRKKT